MNCSKSLFARATVASAGISLFFVGAMIAQSLDKSTLQNQIGFGIYIAGIAISILGVAATFITSLEGYLDIFTPFWAKRRRLLARYTWVIAVGAVLIAVGLITATNIEKHSIMYSTTWRY
jgi:cytochrome c biogenesis protein CcdA